MDGSCVTIAEGPTDCGSDCGSHSFWVCVAADVNGVGRRRASLHFTVLYRLDFRNINSLFGGGVIGNWKFGNWEINYFLDFNFQREIENARIVLHFIRTSLLPATASDAAAVVLSW